jgi:hypothetical protein
MSPRIIECVQGEPEWFAARAGLPTASEFATVMAKGRDGGQSVTRKTYMYKLAGEILTGEPMESYSNAHMERGRIMEDEARDWYAFDRNIEPQRVGFIVNDAMHAGCSPDSLIGSDGGLEIKSACAHVQIERLTRNDLPPEHKAQVQGSLWVSGREWWDFVSYCPKLPPLCVRVPRDNGYIATLAGTVKQFNEELAELVEKIRRYGQPTTPLSDLLMAG